MIVTATTDDERQMIANLEAGRRCPCGSTNLDDFLGSAMICVECGEVNTVQNLMEEVEIKSQTQGDENEGQEQRTFCEQMERMH